MNYVTRVDIVKAASDTRYLMVGVSMRSSTTGGYPQDHADLHLGAP